MSLEVALKENTAVMRELIEVLTRTSLPEAQSAAKKPAKTKSAPAANEPSAVAAAAENPPEKAPADESSLVSRLKDGAQSTPPATTTVAIEYAYLASRIKTLVALGSEGRAEAVKILAARKAATGKDLKVEQYESVLQEIEAAINLYQDELA